MDHFLFQPVDAETAALAEGIETNDTALTDTLSLDELLEIMGAGQSAAFHDERENHRTPERTPKKPSEPAAPARHHLVSALTSRMPSNTTRAHSSRHEIGTFAGKPGPAAAAAPGGGYQVIVFGGAAIVEPLSPVRGVVDPPVVEESFTSAGAMNMTELCVAASYCRGAQLAMFGDVPKPNIFALPNFVQAKFEHSSQDASPVVAIGGFVPDVPFVFAPSPTPALEFYFYVFAYFALTGKVAGQTPIPEGAIGQDKTARTYCIRNIRMKTAYVPGDWETGAYKFRAVVADGRLGGPTEGRSVSVFMSPPFRLIKAPLDRAMRSENDVYIRDAARLRLAARAAATSEPPAKQARA